MRYNNCIIKTILFIGILLLSQTAKGQWSFQATFSTSGSNCNNVQYQNVYVSMYWGWCHKEHVYDSYEECEALRKNSVVQGGSFSGVYNGCRVSVTTSPCVGPGGGSDNGIGGVSNGTKPNVMGLSQGTSFFSPNPANEIRYWAEDNEELMKRIGGEEPVKHEIVMDNGYVFSADMPGTIHKFLLDDTPSIYGDDEGIHAPDGFFDRPFHLDTGDDVFSDDYRNIKTELRPVQFTEEIKPPTRTNDIAWDDFGDIIKFGISLPLYAQAATLFVADMAVNLVIEDIKMALKLSRGEYVKMDEVTSTIAYNTLNKSIQDALYIVSSKGIMKAFPIQQLPESVYSGSQSFITTFVSIHSRHINAE